MLMLVSFSRKASLLFLFLCLFFNILSSTTCTFTNGGGDNMWSNAANWDTGIVPDADDDAIVNSGNVTINQDVSVHSLTIGGAATVSFTHSGTVYLDDLYLSGGGLESTGKIVINNGFNWTGNSSITASDTFELAVTCAGIISGDSNRNLYAQIVNYGTCTHSGGSLRFQTGGSLVNYGTYTFDGADFIINTGGGDFTNFGTVNKSNINTLNAFVSFVQDGSGQLNIDEGTFKLLSGGTNTGSSITSIASGAKLEISSALFDSGSGSSISGSGDVEFLSGTSTIDGAFNVSGITEVSGGTVNFNHSDPIIFTTLTLSGGTVQGSSHLIVSGNLDWTGTSTIASNGSVTLAGTSTGLIYSGGAKKLYSTFVNNGTISHTGGNFRFYPGGNLENNGNYIVNGPSNIYDDGGGSFDNNGTFEHQKNSSLNFYPDFNNNVSGSAKGKGTIAFSNLTNLGTFAADAVSGALNLAGNFDLGKSLEIGFNSSDHGSFTATGDIVLDGDLDVTVSGSVPEGTYTILSTSSGTISGTFVNANIPSDFAIQYTATEVNLMVGVLPVELTYFDVSAQRENMLLNWQTASEINSESFVIEHSPDGQYFSDIGKVAATGSSNSPQDYQFVHEKPNSGLNYYRLRMHDLDGSYEHSVMRVESFYYYEEEVQVSPNPSHGLITLKNVNDKTFKIVLRDLSGNIVYSKAQLNPGAEQLDLRSLSKSMYILEIFDDAYYTQKVKIMILE